MRKESKIGGSSQAYRSMAVLQKVQPIARAGKSILIRAAEQVRKAENALSVYKVGYSGAGVSVRE